LDVRISDVFFWNEGCGDEYLFLDLRGFIEGWVDLVWGEDC